MNWIKKLRTITAGLVWGVNLNDPNNSLASVMPTESKRGISVNRMTALSLPGFYRGCTILAADVARLDLLTYKWMNRGKVVDMTHDAYTCLRYAPNDWQDAYQFKACVTTDCLIEGNGYALVESRKPFRLVPLDPNTVEPKLINGNLIYEVTENGTTETVPAYDMIHIRLPIGDRLKGYSILDIGRESLALALGQQYYASRYFLNDATPGIVISDSVGIDPEAIKESQRLWRMQTEPHAPKFVGHDQKITQLTSNAKDAQLEEQREFELKMQSNWAGGVPASKVGAKDSKAYNSLESEQRAYLSQALDSLLVAWEQQCRKSLLTEAEKRSESTAISFNRPQLLRTNYLERMQAYRTAQEMGVLSANDIAEAEDHPATPEGDQHYRRSDLVPMMEEKEEATDVQGQALNGTQIASMLAIVESVTTGTLAKPSAKAIISASFPLMPAAQVNAIVDPLEVKEPPQPTPPAGNPGGAEPGAEPASDQASDQGQQAEPDAQAEKKSSGEDT